MYFRNLITLSPLKSDVSNLANAEIVSLFSHSLNALPCCVGCIPLLECSVLIPGVLTLFADEVVSSPDAGLSPEDPLPPLILLQQLLSAATQPSPVKAVFDRPELEVRCSEYHWKHTF